ncbi:MAG: hypothetical protein ABI811_12955 [Acidobacteriota bacterium]
MDVVDSEVSRQILALFAVFSLLGLAVWKLRSGKFRLPAWNAGRSTAKAIESVERIALTQHHAVHLLRIHGRELVVATHPQGCSVLLENEVARV